MRRIPRILAAVLVLILIGSSTPAWAAPIHILTGVDTGGSVLSSGDADPLWTISVQGGAFTAAEVAAPGHDIICCGMETVGTQARWISDPSIALGSVATGWGVGPVAVARRTFDLSGYDLSTMTLTGLWRVADNRHGVYLNGNLLAGTADGSSGWFSDQALSASSALFVAGINTLELRGSSVNSGWDGFWLDATVDGRLVGTTPVPEPSTVALLGFGLAAILRSTLRRSNRVRN